MDERYDLFESRLALTQDLKLTEVLRRNPIENQAMSGISGQKSVPE